MAKKQETPPETEPEAAAPEASETTPTDPVDPQDRLEQLQVAATESYEKLSETAAQLTEQARSVYTTGQEHVREKPLAYVVGAFAFGCLLGVLLGRD